MNEHPEIQDFQERAAIMEYDGELLREAATLAAAELVWNREFTLPELGEHLAQLRNRMRLLTETPQSLLQEFTASELRDCLLQLHKRETS